MFLHILALIVIGLFLTCLVDNPVPLAALSFLSGYIVMSSYLHFTEEQ